jgi:hypothetical protein
MGESHAEMTSDLQEELGQNVAIGLCPPIAQPDGPSLISASKGGIDGPR